jgi:hypothetical protein
MAVNPVHRRESGDPGVLPNPRFAGMNGEEGIEECWTFTA